MPPQVQSGKSEGMSVLFKKYGKRIAPALKAVAATPFVAGQMRIPPGIKNGIAQLSKITIGTVADGKKNAGEPYILFEAICQTPKTVVHKGQTMPAQGIVTSQIEMLCDTVDSKNQKTTFEEHLGNAANVLKGLGFVFADEDSVTEKELQRAIKELTAPRDQGGKPYFRFETRESPEGGMNPVTKQPYPAKTWETWFGIQDLADWAPESEGDDGTVDNSGGDEQATGDLTDGTDNSDDNPDGALDDGGTTEETTENPDEAVTGEPEPDFDDLLKRANSKNAKVAAVAQTELTALAVTAGADPDSVENDFGTWEEMVEYIQANTGDPAAEDEAPVEEEWKPKKGDANCKYFHLTLDAKTKKMAKAKKPTEVEVLSVNETDQTVTLKDLVSGKTVVNPTTKKPIGVKWADLVRD